MMDILIQPISIQVHMNSSTELEIWDCVYDEENFVRSGTAKLIDGEWRVQAG